MSADVEIFQDPYQTFWIDERGVWYFWGDDSEQWMAPSYAPNRAVRGKWKATSPLGFLVVTGRNFYQCYNDCERVEEQDETYYEEDYSSQYNDEPS